MSALGRRGVNRGEPRNLMRDGRRCREVPQAATRILETLEGRLDPVIDAFVRLC